MSHALPLPLVQGIGNKPTITLGFGAGTGATVTVTGNNVTGKISLIQGMGGVAGGVIMTLTLADGASFPAGMTVTFAPGNSNFAGLLTALYVSTTASTVTLTLAGLALTAGQVYTGYYQIQGY